MKVNNIILVGFMGTGKSTIGLLLAARLNWKFIDLDLYIEERQNKSISEIFHLHGESYFRQLESKSLVEVTTQQQQVIATGGGIVLAETNRDVMVASGYVVSLDASPEVIIERLRDDQNRPLLQGDLTERVYTLKDQRKEAYRFAHVVIDTTSRSIDEIVNQILQTIN